MTTIDITTTDGDVLLVLGETRLRVSSVILSSASPVFRTMLGPNFSEGQGNRSAENPKEIPLEDDDVATTTRFCRLLHHQNELPETSHGQKPLELRAAAKELYDLAVLADKYNAVQSIRMAGAYLLSELGANSRPEAMPMEVLLYLITTAFIMEDPRHFILFTRRLVMDHADNYSTIAQHPALAWLPSLFLRKFTICQKLTLVELLTTISVLIEEQRKTAWLSLQSDLAELATVNCLYPLFGSVCGESGTDYNIFATLIAKMPRNGVQGPVSWPASNCPLRFVLKGIYNWGSDIHIRVPLGCGHGPSHGDDEKYEVKSAGLKDLCVRINKTALGLCLVCLQANAGNETPTKCSHQQLLERWVENDPFLGGVNDEGFRYTVTPQ